jgi:hypothetical protein
MQNARSRTTSLFIGFFTVALGSAYATEPAGWLQVRDQNPFVLASGLPLAPSVPAAGTWQIDATLSEANTEMLQSERHSSLLFDAETRESRISVAYAFNDRWSARASIGHLWFGDGFLDSPIENFHRIFGFTNGDRGRLGTTAPTIEVRRNDELLYALDRGQSGIGPLLLDLTRSWQLNDRGSYGLSLGAKLPTGSRSRLTDSGSTDVSLSAFTLMTLGERMTLGARLGLLYQDDNRLLGNLARDYVPFAGMLLSYRLGQRWSAIVQADAHGPLYRDLPDFFRTSGLFSFGFSRRFGDTAELLATLSEDLPAGHTTDVVFSINLRINAGAK